MENVSCGEINIPLAAHVSKNGSGIKPEVKSLSKEHTHSQYTHTHKKKNIYIYIHTLIHMYMYVCTFLNTTITHTDIDIADTKGEVVSCELLTAPYSVEKQTTHP